MTRALLVRPRVLNEHGHDGDKYKFRSSILTGE